MRDTQERRKGHRLSAVDSTAQDQKCGGKSEEAEESDRGRTGNSITSLAVGIPGYDQQIRPNDYEAQNSREKFGWTDMGDGRLLIKNLN